MKSDEIFNFPTGTLIIVQWLILSLTKQPDVIINVLKEGIMQNWLYTKHDLFTQNSKKLTPK